MILVSNNLSSTLGLKQWTYLFWLIRERERERESREQQLARLEYSLVGFLFFSFFVPFILPRPSIYRPGPSNKSAGSYGLWCLVWRASWGDCCCNDIGTNPFNLDSRRWWFCCCCFSLRSVSFASLVSKSVRPTWSSIMDESIALRAR